tara:strand:- start:287 stop:520 length:234 start_codon:yes stop_codon:yes gene_type:complete
MTHHMIDGVQVPFTEAEEVEFSAKIQAHTDAAPQRAAIAAIQSLESQVTPRRMREAIADPTWINAQEALIAIERAKL